MNIGVFCASSDFVSEDFKTETKKLGEWIGKNKHTLVYGGATGGLMTTIAQSTHENGGYIIGVIPERIVEIGRKSDLADKLIQTKTMSERKELIKKYSDICIGLPGGFGTIDEIFDTVASSMLGYNKLSTILVNMNGYYDGIIKQFKQMHNEALGYESRKKLLIICNSTEHCINILKEKEIKQ